MLLKCTHCGNETEGRWPARLVFNLAAAEAGLDGTEHLEAAADTPEEPAPTPEVTVAAVKAETDALMKTIEESDLPGDVKGDFKTDVDALLKELAAMGEGATAELIADAQGELVAIQTDLDGVLNPYVALEGVGAGDEAGGFSTEIPIQQGDNVSQLLLANVAGKDAPDHAKVAEHYGIDPSLDGQAFAQALFRLPTAQRSDFSFNLVHPGNKILVHSDGRLQVVQGESSHVPGAPEGKTAPTAAPAEPAAPAPAEGAPAAAPAEPSAPAPAEGAPAAAPAEPSAPEPVGSLDGAAPAEPATAEASIEAPAESHEMSGVLEQRSRASIETNLDKSPGSVDFEYHTAQGNFQFHMERGLVQVTSPTGEVSTYALYRAMDAGRPGGPVGPHSTPPRFYVATEPRVSLGFFSKDAAEKGAWYHGRETKNPTDYAIGMTPEAVLHMATQIAKGEVTPDHSAELPVGEKYQDRGRKERVQLGENHLTLKQVSDGPAGYKAIAEVSQGADKPPIRIYSPTQHLYAPSTDTNGRDKGILVRVGDQQVEAKTTRDTSDGQLVIRYQLPGQPIQKVKIEAPTETVSPDMKARLEQHAARTNKEASLVVQDSEGHVLTRVVEVGGSTFYQEANEGAWRIVSGDGEHASLYPGDPLAMNRLENQLAILGVKYKERDIMSIGVGNTMFLPDAAATSPTEVTYRATAEDGRLLKLTVSGNPTAENLPYTLTEVNSEGAPVEEPHHYGSKAALEADFQNTLATPAPTAREEVAPTAQAEPAEDPAPSAPEVDVSEPVASTAAALPAELPADAAAEGAVEATPEATLTALEAMEQSILKDIMPLVEGLETSDTPPEAAVPPLLSKISQTLKTYLSDHELPEDFEKNLQQMTEILDQMATQFQAFNDAMARLTEPQKERFNGIMKTKDETLEAGLHEALVQSFTDPKAIDRYLVTFNHLFDDLKTDSELGTVAISMDQFFDQMVILGKNWIEYKDMKSALEPTS